MRPRLRRPASSRLAGLWTLVAVTAVLQGTLPAQEPSESSSETERENPEASDPAALPDYSISTPSMTELFDWDLISLEQNNPRFNASVLSGFHSVRSPGVTPYRSWKTGLGVLYTREERVAEATNSKLYDQEQVILNPKINYGFYHHLEAGLGFETTWTSGEDIIRQPDGTIETDPNEAFEANTVDLGLKWRFLEEGRLRLALSYDVRIAINRGAFGTLPSTLHNVEIDGDFAVTNRFGMISNLQYLTTDNFFEVDQVVFDLGAAYFFSDRFRGMLFGTLQSDDEADDVLIFWGFASQYVFERHSFTFAVDIQLNEADRDVRTQSQLDLEFSYTYTF